MRLLVAAVGSVNAYVTNNAGGIGRTNVEQTGLTGDLATIYQVAQKVGDAASTITGGAKVAAAGGSEAITAGVATPVAIPLAIHGGVTMGVSLKNLFTPIKFIEGAARSGGREPNERGAKAERATGSDKPGEKERYVGASGQGREADKSTKTQLHETKDVAYQYLSTQIRDGITHAQNGGEKIHVMASTIYTGIKTVAG